MSLLQAIIQGIVQGLTEFLPVSSSGHLAVTQHILGVNLDSIFFDILLHLGTLIAVCFVYYKLIGRLIAEFFRSINDIFHRRFSFKDMSDDRRLLVMLVVGLIPLFLLFIPIPGTDMKLKDLSDMWGTDSNILVEGIAFIVTSILLSLAIVLGGKSKSSSKKRGGAHFFDERNRTQIRFGDAVAIGITQLCAALVPGLSRSGSTMSAGMMKGVNKQTALDYSFVLGIPTILAAAVFSLKDISSADMASLSTAVIIAGIVSSAVFGFLAIKLFKWLVASDKLIIFAVYTLILGIVCIVISVIEFKNGVNIFTKLPL